MPDEPTSFDELPVQSNTAAMPQDVMIAGLFEGEALREYLQTVLKDLLQRRREEKTDVALFDHTVGVITSVVADTLLVRVYDQEPQDDGLYHHTLYQVDGIDASPRLFIKPGKPSDKDIDSLYEGAKTNPNNPSLTLTPVDLFPARLQPLPPPPHGAESNHRSVRGRG